MLKKTHQDNRGFTIIEVLIVLAIAGLIMLIVFLAVPSLQRNNRNTQRRNDISNLLGAVSEYASNNNGNLPTSATNIIDNAQTSYYKESGTNTGNINYIPNTPAQNALGTTAPNDRVVIVAKAKCGTGGATVAGSARQVAAQFLVETSSGWQAQCQDS